MKPLCIYHANCVDGFTAAWAVKRFFKDQVEFFAADYQTPPPAVKHRNVIIVDFSYPREVINKMAKDATTLIILDHHKTAARDLDGIPQPTKPENGYNTSAMLYQQTRVDFSPFALLAIFDMERSGAGITWDFFHPGQPRPKLVDYVEDRDLWRFNLPESKAINAIISSWPFDFATWDYVATNLEDNEKRINLSLLGHAILRSQDRAVEKIIDLTRRQMTIGHHTVNVANAPKPFESEVANRLAAGQPFAATYFDAEDGRHFSLRSDANGLDVSEIAKRYGGGGHTHAAGFKKFTGWEGE